MQKSNHVDENVIYANRYNKITRDGKVPELSKNEPNQNPGFAKNRTETEPESEKVQEPESNTNQKCWVLPHV